MKIRSYTLALFALHAFGPLAACTSDTGADTLETSEYVCGTTWFGALPGYVEPSVSIRACLSESNCTGEQVLTTERGASGAFDNFQFSAHYYPSGSGNYLYGEENNLDVHFEFSPEFAATLTDSDRATLVVWADDGSVMIDSTSEVPYRSSSPPSDGKTCKGVFLDLDGSERVVPAE